MNDKKIIYLIAFLGVMVSASLALAPSSTYYAKTTVYFFISSDAKFSVALLNNWNVTNITGTTEGGATAINGSTGFVSFNLTAVPVINNEPCVQGVATNCQAHLNGIPIMRLINTGNVNEEFDIYAGAAMPAGLNISVNATCQPNAGCGTVQGTVLNISSANVIRLASSVGTSQILNVTMFGWATSLVGQSASVTLYINSTAV